MIRLLSIVVLMSVAAAGAGCASRKKPMNEFSAKERYRDYVPEEAKIVAEGTGILSFKAPEEEQEARQKELADFLSRTTMALINAGYMGRDNDKRICWWTGKSDRPRPPRQQEQERPQEQPGAGIPEEVKREIEDSGVPF